MSDADAIHRALEAAARRVQVSGIALTADQLDRLTDFVTLLRDWSTRINLVSRRELPLLVEKHVLPSLAPLLAGPLAEAPAIPTGKTPISPPFGASGDGVSAAHALSALDVGSGGGFPGLVLAIARPGWAFTLLEPIRKKTLFLQAAARDLANVRVLRERAEALRTDPDHAGRHQLITARAVGPPHEIWALTRPLLAPLGELHVFVARDALAAAVRQLDDSTGDVEVLTPIEPPWHPGAILRVRAAR